MKTSASLMIFVLIATALGIAETPSPFGAWTIYHAQGNQVFMLQTVSRTTAADSQHGTPQVKLDVICRGGKLSAIALEPAAAINKKAVSFTGVVPTTRVNFTLDQVNESENWALADDGHTLSPYSEVFQSRLNRLWVTRISSSKTMGVQIAGKTGELDAQPIFETEDLSAALTSVGCSY